MANKAIVFLHGHMGSSAQFEQWLPMIGAGGADVHNASLPGHGSTLDEFVKNGRGEWEKCVADLLNDLRSRYEGIFMVGHSMGGLLSVCAAVQAPQKIEAVVAIALPLQIKLSYEGLKIRFLSVCPQKPDEDPRICAARQFCGVGGLTAWNAFRLLPNTVGLLKMIRHTRRALDRLTVPLTVINSAGDEVVSEKSLRIVRDKLPRADIVELKASSHFLYTPEESRKIVSVIRDVIHGNAGVK
ncbi:MAG: alpha/beta hydrolase [Christensenellales bacterium]|jgi:carboxylesterase